LAKEIEEAQLMQEMQTEIVRLTLQRLATIRP
jgi:outer membrane lipopolysaccharide assembly protein LptE/RlpB